MIVTALRLIFTALLIWRVAVGDHWALVIFAVRMAITDEMHGIFLDKILKNDAGCIRPRP